MNEKQDFYRKAIQLGVSRVDADRIARPGTRKCNYGARALLDLEDYAKSEIHERGWQVFARQFQIPDLDTNLPAYRIVNAMVKQGERTPGRLRIAMGQEWDLIEVLTWLQERQIVKFTVRTTKTGQQVRNLRLTDQYQIKILDQ